MSDEGRETLDYLLCYLTDERDPDMSGFAVRLSSLVINVCLAILIRWSDRGINKLIGSIFLPYFTLLLSTFISMIRKRLSLADANFSISLTRSPVAVYFMYATIRDMMGKSTHLFGSKKGSRLALRSFTFGLLAVWIILTITINIGGSRVFEKTCPSVSLRTWFAMKIIRGGLDIGIISVLIAIPILAVYVFYSLRHWRDIREEYRYHRGNVQRRRWVPWVQTFFVSIKNFVLSQWVVVTHSHSWILIFLATAIYIAYGLVLSVTIIDVQAYYIYLARDLARSVGVPFNPPTLEYYDPAGFGQLLAASCALEPLWQTACLVWTNKAMILRVPQYFWDGIVFAASGRRNPWTKVRAEKMRSRMAGSGNADSYYELPLVDEFDGSGQTDREHGPN